jgi:periplasmic protein TonB
MFDAVLNGDAGQPRPLGSAAAISLAVHLLALALIAWATTRARAFYGEGQPAITFMAGPRALGPPAGPPLRSVAGKASPRRELAPIKKRSELHPPTESLPKRPAESNPPPDSPGNAEPSSMQGVEAGIAGGATGGVVGGGLAGSLRMEVLPFGQGMTRPTRIAGQDPVYTREALEARIEGLTIVKCVITAEGKAENCRMIKALPHMEKAVLEALATQTFKPVTFQGRPVSVDYVFNIRLALPRY